MSSKRCQGIAGNASGAGEEKSPFIACPRAALPITNSNADLNGQAIHALRARIGFGLGETVAD